MNAKENHTVFFTHPPPFPLLQAIRQKALRCPLRRALAPFWGGHIPYLLPPRTPRRDAALADRCSSNLAVSDAAAVVLAKLKVSRRRPPPSAFWQSAAAALPISPGLPPRLGGRIAGPVRQMPPFLPATHFGGRVFYPHSIALCQPRVGAHIVRLPARLHCAGGEIEYLPVCGDS